MKAPTKPAPLTAAELINQRPVFEQREADATRRWEDMTLAASLGQAAPGALEAAAQELQAARDARERFEAHLAAQTRHEAEEARKREALERQGMAEMTAGAAAKGFASLSRALAGATTTATEWQTGIAQLEAAIRIAGVPAARGSLHEGALRMRGAVLFRFGGLLPGDRPQAPPRDVAERLLADLYADFVRAGLPMPPLPTKENTNDA